MLRKIFLLSFLLVFSFIFGKRASADCDAFNFPKIQNEEIFFFSCEIGQIQKIDKSNQLSSLSKDDILGGLIHNFIWSPNGKKALILAENVLPAKQILDLYSSDRELYSLIWWLYDIETKNLSILDSKIISAGWATDDMVVYNENNSALYLATVSNQTFSNPEKLTDIIGDSNLLEKIISPENLNGSTLFPLEKGFYFINSQSKSATYHLVSERINKIAANPFTKDYFLIQSGSALQKFSPSGEILETLDNNFPAKDFDFLTGNSLVTIESAGEINSYDLTSKMKTLIPSSSLLKADRVFSLEKSHEFLFSLENKIYRKNASDESAPVLATSKEKVQAEVTGNIQPSGTNPPDESPSYWVIVAGMALLAIGIFGAVVYFRKNRQ